MIDSPLCSKYFFLNNMEEGYYPYGKTLESLDRC